MGSFITILEQKETNLRDKYFFNLTIQDIAIVRI